MNWFAFDFQLLSLPLIIVLMVFVTDQRENRRYTIDSYYGSTIAILWLMHLASFIINRSSFNKKFYDERQINDYRRPGVERDIYRPVME